MLDLAQFASLEDALAKIDVGRRYVEVGKLLASADERPITMPVLFFMSMISRCEGLHGAIVREIRAANPHAVFPLIRAFAEATVLVIYVTDHVSYIDVLTARAKELPQDGPKRKGMQALISYASDRVPGMKAVYAELSEATHFGAIAMWAAHELGEDDEEGTFRMSWQNWPRWKSEVEALVACAQTLELAEAMELLLRQFAGRHLLSAPA